MTYYCFLCNQTHNGSPTEEHFIPRSIDGPEHQWLPVCEDSNKRSNIVFDSNARDLLYWARFNDTKKLKREGEALLGDETLKPFKFSYREGLVPQRSSAFQYIFDKETNTHVASKNVCAIAFPIGLSPHERITFCRGLAKISLGAIAFRLKKQGVDEQIISQVFTQSSFESMRLFALAIPLPGKAAAMEFSLGRSDVLVRLHSSCKNQQLRNHVLVIKFQKNSIHISGMLYSQYGWELNLTNQISLDEQELRLENPISCMNAPESFIDHTLSPDAICIINPDFLGQKPNIPLHWRNE